MRNVIVGAQTRRMVGIGVDLAGSLVSCGGQTDENRCRESANAAFA